MGCLEKKKNIYHQKVGIFLAFLITDRSSISYGTSGVEMKHKLHISKYVTKIVIHIPSMCLLAVLE